MWYFDQQKPVENGLMQATRVSFDSGDFLIIERESLVSQHRKAPEHSWTLRWTISVGFSEFVLH